MSSLRTLLLFVRLDAVVIGCSRDSPNTYRQFIAKHRLKVTLLSDPTHAMMKDYGVWGKKVLYGKTSTGVIRSTVLLDPAGTVATIGRKLR